MRKYKSKKDFLLLMKEHCLGEIAQAEVDIEIFVTMPDSEVVGQDTTKAKPEDVTAKEALKRRNQNVKVLSDRLTAIESLLKSESLLNKIKDLF